MRIEIVDYKTSEIIQVINCAGKTERQVNKIDDGLNINLNHSEYFTRIIED